MTLRKEHMNPQLIMLFVLREATRSTHTHQEGEEGAENHPPPEETHDTREDRFFLNIAYPPLEENPVYTLLYPGENNGGVRLGGRKTRFTYLTARVEP